MQQSVLIVTIQIFCYFATITCKTTCKNEDGLDVDWFYMYKLPKNFDSNAASNKTGLRYMFVTSENYKNGWILSERQIDDASSLTAQTLQPVMNDKNVLLLAYNDEFPDGTTKATRGHTKGVVATDAKTGFWLIHSVPKFPSIPDYSFPATGAIYAQSMLCVSLSAAEMHKVGTQLLYNEPHIYYANMPLPLKGKFPEIERVIDKQWLRATPNFNQLEIKSLGGTSFASFAKNSRFGQDLYEDLVAPKLDVNLLVETWRKGTGNLPSNCTRSDKVLNISELESAKLRLSFKTTTDHSKWAVSQASGIKLWRWRIGGTDWICVGDINRQLHQYERGGGTLCQKHMQIAELYRDLISQYEPCSRQSKLIA